MTLMRVVNGLSDLRRPPRRAAVTIGMFDGVHVGHRRLIDTTTRLATQIDGTSVVLTFHPDPQVVLAPARARPPLMSLEDRLRILRSLGIDLVCVVPFTKRFSRTSPEAFVRNILLRRLRARYVIVGQNFMFGRKQQGGIALLRAMGEPTGMHVITLPPVTRDGQVVSSSRIRDSVVAGRLAEAQRFLGHPLTYSGMVVQGDGRARRLGFPTANLQFPNLLLPPHGVYLVQLSDGHRTWRGLMNLGTRPTFTSGTSRQAVVTCEVHLPNFRGSLYDRRVTVTLFRRLRDERRFARAEDLIRQIRRDLDRAGLTRRRARATV